MLTVVNFSHPLEENRRDVLDILGDEYKVISVPVQVDMDASILQEVELIYQAAIEAVNGNSRNIDVILLPDLVIVAVLLVAKFRQNGYVPNVLVLARVKDVMPPRFEVAELIKSFNL